MKYGYSWGVSGISSTVFVLFLDATRNLLSNMGMGKAGGVSGIFIYLYYFLMQRAGSFLANSDIADCYFVRLKKT